MNVKYVKLMSVLCLNVCRLCMPNIMSLSIGLKNAPRQSWHDTVSKLAIFSVSVFEEEKLTKKQTYTKTETCKSIIEYFEYFCQMS